MPASSGFGSPTVGSALRARSYPNRPTAPPAKGGRPVERRDPIRGQLLRDVGVGIRVVAQVHAHDRARAKAEKRPAPDTLALLGGLQQEGRPGAAQLEIGGDRGLAVRDERVAQRDEVVVASQLAHLLEARRQVEVNGDGH